MTRPFPKEFRAQTVRVSRVVTYEQAVEAATAVFSATGALDMEQLERELAVSRATLYRVVQGRDRLLGDVLWSTGERALRRALAAQPGRGIDRLVPASHRQLTELVAWPAFRRFLVEDRELAFRVLFTPAGRVHERIVGLWQDVLQEAVDGGELALPYRVEDAAAMLVALAEVVVFRDLFVGREPDLDLLASAQRALLRGP